MTWIKDLHNNSNRRHGQQSMLGWSSSFNSICFLVELSPHYAWSGFVPEPKYSILFNWAGQKWVHFMEILEITRDFDEAQNFGTNVFFNMETSIWRCEWLIECVQHLTRHGLSTSKAQNCLFPGLSHLAHEALSSDFCDWWTDLKLIQSGILSIDSVHLT